VSNKSTIRDAFLSSQRIQNLTKITQSNLRNEKEIRNNLKSNAIKKNVKNNTKYREETTKKKNNSESNEIENKKINKALQ